MIKETINITKHKPDTVNGFSVTIHITYSSFYEHVITDLYKSLFEQCGQGIVTYLDKPKQRGK